MLKNSADDQFQFQVQSLEFRWSVSVHRKLKISAMNPAGVSSTLMLCWPGTRGWNVQHQYQIAKDELTGVKIERDVAKC